MSIWPQNKNRKFDYQKCFRGEMPNFSNKRFNFFFRINELLFEEDNEPKKSGYHSLKNYYLTHKTLFEVFPIDGTVTKRKLKKWKRYSLWNFLSHIIPELRFNLKNFCYLKRCNVPHSKSFFDWIVTLGQYAIANFMMNSVFLFSIFT